MSAQDQIEVDRHFDRLRDLAADAGCPEAEDWVLYPGRADTDPRQPWVMVDGDGDPIMTLGFTRRSVQAALSSMNEILSVINS